VAAAALLLATGNGLAALGWTPEECIQQWKATRALMDLYDEIR
jgi:hypothetical protein